MPGDESNVREESWRLIRLPSDRPMAVVSDCPGHWLQIVTLMGQAGRRSGGRGGRPANDPACATQRDASFDTEDHTTPSINLAVGQSAITRMMTMMTAKI